MRLGFDRDSTGVRLGFGCEANWSRMRFEQESIGIRPRKILLDAGIFMTSEVSECNQDSIGIRLGFD